MGYFSIIRHGPKYELIKLIIKKTDNSHREPGRKKMQDKHQWTAFEMVQELKRAVQITIKSNRGPIAMRINTCSTQEEKEERYQSSLLTCRQT